jgi:hypothetical protein
MATFPSITPTGRSFRPGVYPQKTYRALSGAVVKRTYGNSPYNAQFDLEFDNISDEMVNLLLDHYHSQTAANARFDLSANVTAGMVGGLAFRANGLFYNLRWEYANPPEVQSIRSNVSSVRISLTGEIRDPRLDG